MPSLWILLGFETALCQRGCCLWRYLGCMEIHPSFPTKHCGTASTERAGRHTPRWSIVPNADITPHDTAASSIRTPFQRRVHQNYSRKHVCGQLPVRTLLLTKVLQCGLVYVYFFWRIAPMRAAAVALALGQRRLRTPSPPFQRGSAAPGILHALGT